MDRARPAGLVAGSTSATSSTSASKRRATVRCAAANDDEDLGGLFDVKADLKRQRRAAPEASDSAAPASIGENVKLRSKEFAWMDSDDENGQERDGEKADDAEEDGDDEDVEVTPESLDAVQSFGRMMLVAPSLLRRLRDAQAGPADIAAACRALKRTKFFDADILGDLSSELKRLLDGEKLDVVQTNDAIQCLAALNAYDRPLFSAVARAFKSKTGVMDPGMRNSWVEVFKVFGHDSDEDFIQLLEVPPVPPVHPSYRKVRCRHLNLSRGTCALDGACTFSHDPRAPFSLIDMGSEDSWRARVTVMTEDQSTMGRGSYGDSKCPPPKHLRA
mmetsp:Transcript_107466/g.302414  ORF Transcript_107466/g.302414 Transcript_107466/m.302414 type:complete len:332 (+) Transcript_107466:57-1052(+)